MQRLNIACLRAQNKWTQEYVATKIGITKQAYSNIETGKRKPSYKVIIKLQQLFNTTIDYLLEQEVDKDSNTE